MKNFLLAVALLSIGTAVAAGSDDLTNQAAENLNQIMRGQCLTDLNTGIEKQKGSPLSASEVLSIGEICECTGKKYESLVKRIGLNKWATMIDSPSYAPLYGKFVKKCKDAWWQKHK